MFSNQKLAFVCAVLCANMAFAEEDLAPLLRDLDIPENKITEPSAAESPIAQLHSAAEAGDTHAQVLLGLSYFYGKDVDQDRKAAAKWLKMATAAPEAYNFSLGECYLLGAYGVKHDPKEAQKYLTKVFDFLKNRKSTMPEPLRYSFKIGPHAFNFIGKELYDLTKAKEAPMQYAQCIFLQASGTSTAQMNLEAALAYAADNGDRLACKLVGARLLSKEDAIAQRYLAQGASVGDPEAALWLGLAKWYGASNIKQDQANALLALKEAANGGFEIAYPYLARAALDEKLQQINVEEAKHWLSKMVEPPPDLLYKIAKCYETGTGCAKATDTAIYWYRYAARQGYADAQAKMGDIYQLGLGLEKNSIEARKWHQWAAENHNPHAMYELAQDFANGIGGAIDLAQAATWYEAAARAGVAKAYAPLAKAYAKGKGVKANDEKAAEWFLMAAEQGDSESQYNLAVCYLSGKGVLLNNDVGAVWLKRAAEQGLPEAAYNLGILSMQGLAQPKDLTKAADWFERAAKGGLSEAQYQLARAYYFGNGRAVDFVQARHWYAKATEQKNPMAIYRLGLLDYFGEGGPVNKVAAFSAFKQAAELGLANAQFNLAVCYEQADGCALDKIEAMRWYLKAAEQGHKEAQARLSNF